MSQRPIRVIKLGGSLLDLADLAERFAAWRAAQPPMADIVLVGGGGLCDAIRALDRARPLDPSLAHWLCIRAMSLTAAIACDRLKEARLLDNLAEARRAASAGELVILDAWTTLNAERGAKDTLPESWDVSSDSIAARLAQVLEAEELVLVKSAPPGATATPSAWAASGYADPYFAEAVRGPLTVRAVDLRNFAGA